MPVLSLRFRLVAHRLLSLLILFTLSTPIFAPMPVAAAPSVRIVRVKADGLFVNSGESWEKATSLSGALQHANFGDEIWVAAGVYIPSTADSSFPLYSRVALYGGFAADEDEREQRNPTLHVTILSGDMDNDDTKGPTGVIANATDIVGGNAYHIVMGAGTLVDPLDSSTVLDGFTITGGDAPGTSNNPCTSCGGGLVMFNGSATLANLVFSGNRAGVGGGGMYLSTGSPNLTNVTFSGNQGYYGGGGMYNDHSNSILNGVTFRGNWATAPDGSGGGLYNYYSNPLLTNIVFRGNWTTKNGGGLYNYNSAPTLTDVTFIHNWSVYGGGMYNDGSSPILTNGLFTGNRAGNYGGGIYHGSGNLILTNATLSGNQAIGAGGGMAINGGFALIQNVVMWGNSPGPADFYLTSHPTFGYSVLEGSNPPGTANLNGTDSANAPQFVQDVNCGSNGCTDDPATPEDESANDDYGDLHLLIFSTAIDAGDNNADLDDDGPGTATIASIPNDVAGQPRIVAFKKLPPTVDMGAYEHVSTPSAAAGGPYSANEGSSLALDGGAADDDSNIALYAWDCTNDGTVDASAATPTGSTCTYPDDGSYILRLTVTDNVSNTDTATTTVTVANVAPTYTPASNQSTFAANAKLFTLGSFTDPGAEGSWPVSVDWGDNSPLTQFSVTGAGALPAKSHTYAGPGSYNVVVTVDDGEANDDGGFEVSVNPLPPGAPSVTPPADATATAGVDQSFALGSFADAGDNGPWLVSVDWGDSSTNTQFSASAAGTLPAKPHTYAAADTYEIVVTVNDGALSASASFRVTVGAESNAGSVTGLVFDDANANGTQESGELGVGGAGMTLATAGEAIAAGAELTRTTTSDANGHYRFDNVPAGDYTLTVTPPSGFATVGASQAPVSVQSGKTTTAPTFALEATEGGSDGSIFLPEVQRP